MSKRGSNLERGRKPSIEVAHLSKSFGDTQAVRDISFSVGEGSFTSLLGASGSGKTTTLRILAGLERAANGVVAFDGDPVDAASRKIFVPPERRKVGFVFQNYALWPHMTVFDHAAFPLKMDGVRSGLRNRIMDALQLVGLEEHLDRYPSELSGGQQQRVALARALVAEPSVLLLDEPLSNLDAELRDYMRGELQRLHGRLGTTTVYVTHDQREALSLSDQVIVMQGGRITDRGTPEDVYERPNNVETARFVGASNVLGATISQADGSGFEVKLDCGPIFRLSATALVPLEFSCAIGGRVAITFKAEDAAVLDGNDVETPGILEGSIRSLAYAGPFSDVLLLMGESEVRVRAPKLISVDPVRKVKLALDLSKVRVMAEESLYEPTERSRRDENPTGSKRKQLSQGRIKEDAK